MAGLGQKLEIRQGQGLVITPQLQQAIKLLQLSNMELEAFVEGELERNPLLARDDNDPDRADTNEPVEAADAPADRAEMIFEEGGSAAATDAVDARPDDVYGDASPGEKTSDRLADSNQPLGDWSTVGRGGSIEADEDLLDRVLRREISLAEHLQNQAALMGFTPVEHAVALALIDGVDEGGYLRVELLELADRLGWSVERIEAVLVRCQSFEPTGVLARSVTECLALQLKEKNRLDPAMQTLLDNLELVARRDFGQLRALCGVDDEDMAEMMAELKALTPRPGAAFGGEPSQTVVADVFVKPDPAGGWRVELNADTLPRLLVDKRYHAVVQASARSDEDKTFVAECSAQAAWLVKSLDQRAKTILKVASEIVRQQDAFLAFGVECLRPLNLKTVADAIGMHESTVSRVTSNKYLATPRGLFELKFFFTSAINSTDGAASHSAEAVRHKIKLMIEAESAEAAVLSDDRIVEILKEAGVDIARRTVAKYREALRIPSSVERRRLLRTG